MGFVQWDTIQSFSGLVGVTYMAVQFTKDMPIINKIRTKYLSALISFALILAVNIHQGTFKDLDIVLYFLSGLAVSFSANGMSDFPNLVDKTSKDIKKKIINKK